jgi:Zn-dependent protease with chaperone function
VAPAARAAIAAHLAARFRNNDLARRAWIASSAGFLVELLSHAGWWELGVGVGLLVALVVVFGILIAVTYLATLFEAWWLRRYEFRTDRRAAVLCGDRRRLIEALEAVESDVANDHWPNPAGRGNVRELFFVDPKAADAYAPFQPPVPIRIAALRRSRPVPG